MSSNKEVLSDIREEWREKVDQAHSEAQEQLEEQILGERVVLRYAKPYLGSRREPKVEGVVGEIETGSIPEDNIEFAVMVTFEGGQRFSDPETIELVGEDPDREWRHVEAELPPKNVTGLPLSKSVEVYLDTGARQIDRYNHEEGHWETELENLEDTGMIGEYVQYWKPLEPSPEIEGRYQNGI